MELLQTALGQLEILLEDTPSKQDIYMQVEEANMLISKTAGIFNQMKKNHPECEIGNDISSFFGLPVSPKPSSQSSDSDLEIFNRSTVFPAKRKAW